MKKHYPILLPFIQALILILIVTCLFVASVVALQIVEVVPLRLPSNVLSADFGVRFAVLTSPTITNDGGASGVTDNDATLNGEITSTGNENPTVIVYWGPVDGGTVPAAWTNNITLGVEPLGAVSYTATDNFTPSTMYRYRYYCYNSAGSDWADSTANFTTAGGAYNPPTGLTLTDLGGITVTANWTKSATANNTLIRISRTSFPESVTDGEWWYEAMDSSVNITSVNLEVMTLYVSAWSELSGNYSTTYATASIGGEGMTEIAAAIDAFTAAFEDFQSNVLLSIIALVLIVVINILAFQQKNVFLYCLCVPMDFVYGLSYAILSDVYSAGWIIGVVVAVIGTFCLFRVAIDEVREIKRRRSQSYVIGKRRDSNIWL